MTLTFYGAAGEVTGSCTLLDAGRQRILVDCGLFQGSHDSFARNLEQFPFDPSSIDALILTHAHIDHIGRVPKLVNAGFRGPIYTTPPTRLLAKVMWQDAAHVMKDDARRHGKEPLYAPKDVAAVFERVVAADYGVTTRIGDDVAFRFLETGHIFGSAAVYVEAGGKRFVFSGDVGNDMVPILRQTEDLPPTDVLVMESTYGNRFHEPASERVARLKAAVTDTAARGGVLLIPAFSLERTQEILYELNGLVESGAVPKVTMFLDSPLAIKVLPIYHQFPQYYNREAKALKDAGDDFFQFPGLRITKDGEESEAIKDAPSPKVIIAGSGMMHGGRIMKHLAEYLDDPNNTVLVVGYQSAGTVGRAVAQGAPSVRIEHHEIPVRAHVETVGAYSAHADQDKLVAWAKASGAKTIFLNHGEPDAAEALAERLVAEPGVAAHVPRYGEAFPLA
jgi:metallo-beta-lactamase family protein